LSGSDSYAYDARGRQTSETPAQLLEAYPEFAGSWASFRESDMFAPEEPYNHLGRLAEHLVAAMQATNTLGFDRLFGEVEKLLVVATPATRGSTDRRPA